MQKPRRRVGRLLAGLAVIAATGITAPSVAQAAPATASGSTGATETYVVLFKGTSSPSNAGTLVSHAGGSVVADYATIGVLIARSDNTAFASNISANNTVEGAAATTRYATKLTDPAGDAGGANGSPGDLPNAQATDTDSLSPLQWDMRQIHTPEAHGITGGSPAVLVGDIDTGLDYRHPDLR
jgi:hypothetical protein